MNEDRKAAREKLERLADALDEDIDSLSESELLAEAAEDYGDADAAVIEVTALIEQAITNAGKHKIAVARKAYDAHLAGVRPKVLQLSFDRKRSLLDQFASNDNDLRAKITLAARKGEDSEADIDSFLEDLIELGVIDEEGNVK